MPVAIVQTAAVAPTASTSVTVTLGTTPVNGNLLVATFFELRVNPVVSLPPGWAWVPTAFRQANLITIGIAYKVVSGDSASVTFSSDISDRKELQVWEVSGCATSNVVDKSASTVSAGFVASLSTGSTGVLSMADEFAAAMVGGDGLIGGTAVDSGFTLRDTGTHTRSGNADKVTTDTGALNPTFTWNTARESVAAIATFRGFAAVTVTGAAVLSAQSNVVAVGRAPQRGSAALSAQTAAATVGRAPQRGSVALSTQTEIVISASSQNIGAAVFAAETTLAAAGQTDSRAAADLSASTGLTVRVATPAKAALAASATLTVSGVSVARAGVVLAVDTALSAGVREYAALADVDLEVVVAQRQLSAASAAVQLEAAAAAQHLTGDAGEVQIGGAAVEDDLGGAAVRDDISGAAAAVQLLAGSAAA